MNNSKDIQRRMRQIRSEISANARTIGLMTGAFLGHFEDLADEYDRLDQQLASLKASAKRRKRSRAKKEGRL
jgi:hypothetical protein